MVRNRIRTWEGRYAYLIHALDVDSKKWLDGRYQTYPGDLFSANAHAPGAPDHHWQALFAFARGILFERQGVHNQTPGEMAARAWEGIHFPKECTYDDIERVLNRLNAARIRMVKTGRFDGTPASRQREMEDLNGKIPYGSQLKMYMVMKDYRPMNFEQWVDLVRTFQSALPRSKKDSSKFVRDFEPVRMAVESEGEGAIGSWSDVEEEGA